MVIVKSNNNKAYIFMKISRIYLDEQICAKIKNCKRPPSRILRTIRYYKIHI